MIYVLDACALIALTQKERGGETVDGLLANKDHTCIVHALNICEVYYDLIRIAGVNRAKETLYGLVKAGILIIEDMDTDFWQGAGQLKADYRRISIADCMCATLANRTGGEVVTADKEFDPLRDAGECQVLYIR